MISQNKKSSRKGLGKTGSILLSKLSEHSMDVFTNKEAEYISGIKGPKLRDLLYNLMKNKWIERIERGKYLIVPLKAGPKSIHGKHPFLIARKLVDPYYIGFFSALNHYGISEQVSKTTYVVATKMKRQIKFQATEYRFIKIAKKRFFGISEEWMGDHKFRISDKEKTVIDCLFIPKYGGGIIEIVKAFKEELDYEKLYKYAMMMDDLATIKRLGYLLDILKIETQITKKLLKKVSGGYCILDTCGPKTGIKNKKWGVIENIKKEELLVEI